jgi:predicted component of type VI protein secretion system
MTGRLVARTSAGAIAEYPIRARFTIGASAPSDVVLEGTDVAPLHATVEMRDGRCWIEAAGGAPIAINGQPANRRALRHLDVITLGGAHLIFCASTARPEAPRTDRADVVPVRAAKTVYGVPVAAFKPLELPSTRTIDLPISGPPPAFAPGETQTSRSPLVIPSFRPDDTQILEAPASRPIASVRVQGPGVAYEAPIGASLIGRATTAAIRINRPEISRAHAMLTVSAERVTIEDLNSTGGTAVNGASITGTQVLAHGDRLTVGKLDLSVEVIRVGGAS